MQRYFKAHSNGKSQDGTENNMKDYLEPSKLTNEQQNKALLTRAFILFIKTRRFERAVFQRTEIFPFP